MGRPRLFDFKGDVLSITGFTLEEAMAFVTGGEKGTAGVALSPQAPLPATVPLAAAPEALDRPADAPPPAPPPGPSNRPVLDPARIAAIAAGNPAKPPKAEAAPKRGKKPKEEPAQAPPAETVEEEYEVNAAGVEVPVGNAARIAATHGEDPPMDDESDSAEDVPAPPASQTHVNGKANGTNGVSKPARAAAAELPAVLTEAKKLRDVLSVLMDGDPASGLAAIMDKDALKLRCAEIKDQVPCLARITDLDARIDRTLEVMDMAGDVT